MTRQTSSAGRRWTSTRMRRLGIAAVAVVLGAFAAPIAAHHSTAMFEWGKEVKIPAATVVSWEWTNPHTFLRVDVPNAAGGADRWVFEGMSPSHLARNGWSRKSLEAGQKIALSYYPLKDDRKGGFNVTVTFADGKKLAQLPQAMP